MAASNMSINVQRHESGRAKVQKVQLGVQLRGLGFRVLVFLKQGVG